MIRILNKEKISREIDLISFNMARAYEKSPDVELLGLIDLLLLRGNEVCAVEDCDDAIFTERYKVWQEAYFMLILYFKKK
jgi:hypothetical protein